MPPRRLIRPPADLSPRAGGQLIMVAAAFIWSTAGLLQRDLELGAAGQVAGRSVFAAVMLFAIVAVTERSGTIAAFVRIGRHGLALAVCMAVTTAAFMLALNHANVANVLFMQAAAPILAAILGWVLLRERVARRTGIATAIAIGGVALMVGGPGGASAAGHLLTFAMTLSFAIGVVIARHRRDISMAPAACLSQVLVVVVAAPFSSPGEATGHDVAVLAALGLGQIGLGLWLLMVGARLLPPAEVALISLLEVVLGPLWVWLAYGEEPARATLIGGALVVVAVAVQSLADAARRPVAVEAVGVESAGYEAAGARPAKRLSATAAQIASTTPKGQAPERNP